MESLSSHLLPGFIPLPVRAELRVLFKIESLGTWLKVEGLSSHLFPSFIPLPVKAETLGFLSSGLVVEPLPPSAVYVGPPPDAGISFSVV